ncbi:MAG: glycosyltransferase, partial [Xenococcaceae cyanobacterium]
AEQVTAETGFKVLADRPDSAVNAMAQAMIELAENKNLCWQMGRSGQQRVREFYSWQAKGKQLFFAYQEIVSDRKCTS